MQFKENYNSYEELLLHLSTEENARRYLSFVRWGGEPKCPHCSYQGPSKYEENRKIFYCKNCSNQFTVTAGTLFDRTHLPMMKWFRAMFEIANGSVSSVRLAKKLQVTQRTAWKMEQKIRQSLKENLDDVVLANIVEADTTLFTPNLDRDFQRKWVVKKIQKAVTEDNDNHRRDRLNKKQRERRRRKKLGLSSPPTGRPKGSKDVKDRLKKGETRKNKYYQYEKWVLGMVERGGKIYLKTIGRHASEFNSKSVASIMQSKIESGTRVITDGGKEFEKISTHFKQHDKIIHDPWIEFTRKDGTKGKRQIKKFVDGDKHTNSIESTWAHLKRIQWGTHIQISYGHADRYLYEFAFQRNNKMLTDAEKFEIILKSALKMKFPYPQFKVYSREYTTKDGKEIGMRVELNQAA